MLRFLLVLLLGAALGYAYGFHDAQLHDKSIAGRAVDRVAGFGGQAREYSGSNADAVMRRAER